ncbi:hypothetical protein NDU88_001747 [Pleurodeles waltl]|uniref:Uncharacterized protein n=1 Tax=Pleurodeles waltl TaxID=8319 RepID=A0AAV7VCL6_PLEWA|nr:hypothetical protein NDU88_001747 [Pleurodeles waltl]
MQGRSPLLVLDGGTWTALMLCGEGLHEVSPCLPWAAGAEDAPLLMLGASLDPGQPNCAAPPTHWEMNGAWRLCGDRVALILEGGDNMQSIRGTPLPLARP